jgi:Ni/Co efflux regulator RcnB
MRQEYKMGAAFVCAFLLVGAAPAAEPDQGQAHDHAPAPRGAMQGPAHHAPQGEEHRGPSGYARVTEPKGWNNRPATVDRGAYQHNFRAARSYHVGPYHQPAGWAAHSWAYGQILPRAYWTSQYLLSDYWLFSLEVPPAGYEWVRDGSDALLINVDSGEILQVEYGVFA